MNSNFNRKHYYIILALALCALIVPIWLVEVPPLVDLPNHLARIHILAHYAETPFFQQNFQIVYEPIPNLAIDLIVVPLMNVFDIWTANRLFLTLMIILFAIGCHLTRTAETEANSFSVIPASFLIYGGTFFYGYVNYVFGVALFLVALGLWLRWREKLDFKRFSTLFALVSAIYLSHLSTFAFFGVAVFFINAYEFLFSGKEKRKLMFFASDCALFVLPTIAFLTFMTGTGSVGAVRWNSLSGKAVALFGPFRSYDLWLDLLCAGMLAAFIFWLQWRGEIAFDKRLLSTAVFFFILFLVAPNLLFTSGDADVRIVLPAFVLLILSCKINVLKGKVFALFAVLICLLIVRQVTISHRWIQISEKMAAEIKLLDAIQPESRVFPIYVNDGADAEEKLDRPIVHAIHYATFKNSSFTPTVFAFRGQQPLVFCRTQEFATLENKDKMKWTQSLKDNDYVWAYNAPLEVSEELKTRATIVVESGKTKIWKLNK